MCRCFLTKTADICRHETVHWSWSARPVLTLLQHSRWKWMTGAWNKIPHHQELAFYFLKMWQLYMLGIHPSFVLRESWLFLWPHVSFQPVRVTLTLPPPPPLFRLIRCNLKSKIPDSTFSDGIACMFCMAVWIKDWLSLLLSCSNLCPLSLQAGSGEFPKQSGLTFLGRYRLRHFNELKCKAK